VAVEQTVDGVVHEDCAKGGGPEDDFLIERGVEVCDFRSAEKNVEKQEAIGTLGGRIGTAGASHQEQGTDFCCCGKAHRKQRRPDGDVHIKAVDEQKREPEQGAIRAPVRNDAPIAKIAFVSDNVWIDIELSVEKMAEHAVECAHERTSGREVLSGIGKQNPVVDHRENE